MPAESKLEAQARAYAVSKGMFLEKVVSQSRRGWPDRELVGPNGKTIRIEFKAPGKTPDPHQVYVISKLQQLGHECYVISNLAAFKHIVDKRMRKV
tara:strand:+ start:1652 stop:1939 length:288 start_codon:yes stop_codon:yes gene_type:complete